MAPTSSYFEWSYTCAWLQNSTVSDVPVEDWALVDSPELLGLGRAGGGRGRGEGVGWEDERTGTKMDGYP